MYNDFEEPKVQGDKSYTLTLFLAWFFGTLGVHRFYTGKFKTGIAMLLMSLTGFLFVVSAIWALVDIILIIQNKYTDSNGKELADYNAGCGLLALIVLGISFIIGGLRLIMNFLS